MKPSLNASGICPYGLLSGGVYHRSRLQQLAGASLARVFSMDRSIRGFLPRNIRQSEVRQVLQVLAALSQSSQILDTTKIRAGIARIPKCARARSLRKSVRARASVSKRDEAGYVGVSSKPYGKHAPNSIRVAHHAFVSSGYKAYKDLCHAFKREN